MEEIDLFEALMQGIANCIFDRKDSDDEDYKRHYFNPMKRNEIDYMVRKYEDRILDQLKWSEFVDRIEMMIIGLETGIWDNQR